MKYEMLISLTDEDGEELILTEKDKKRKVTIEIENIIYKGWILESIGMYWLEIIENNDSVKKKERIHYSYIKSIQFIDEEEHEEPKYLLRMKEGYHKMFYGIEVSRKGFYQYFNTDDIDNHHVVIPNPGFKEGYTSKFTAKDISNLEEDIPFLLDMFEKVEV